MFVNDLPPIILRDEFDEGAPGIREKKFNELRTRLSLPQYIEAVQKGKIKKLGEITCPAFWNSNTRTHPLKLLELAETYGNPKPEPVEEKPTEKQKNRPKKKGEKIFIQDEIGENPTGTWV